MKCPTCKRKMNEMKTFYYCGNKDCEFKHKQKSNKEKIK